MILHLIGWFLELKTVLHAYNQYSIQIDLRLMWVHPTNPFIMVVLVFQRIKPQKKCLLLMIVPSL